MHILVLHMCDSLKAVMRLHSIRMLSKVAAPVSLLCNVAYYVLKAVLEDKIVMIFG